MKPELLAPAGDMVALRAAIDAGADAVYFGVGKSMRTKNFELSDISKVSRLCRRGGVKAYLAQNAIYFDSDLASAFAILASAKIAGIDAVICWDLAIIWKAREIGLPIHLSTQASIANVAGLHAARELGVRRAVLARECTLDMIKEMKKESSIEIEAFCHGAMCIAISGRCLLSQHLFGKSANRGECLQPCRREYLITDPEEDGKLLVGKGYVMSPKDLCTMPFLEELMGLDCLKIEGRNRKPEYVATVTRCYREAIDLAEKGMLTADKKEEFIDRLKRVYNRGFSSGFYLGKPGPDALTMHYGSLATTNKSFVGTISNYYKKKGVAEVCVRSASFSVGDTVQVQGKTTGVIEGKVVSIQMDHQDIPAAKKGLTVTFDAGFVCRKNDVMYISLKRTIP